MKHLIMIAATLSLVGCRFNQVSPLTSGSASPGAAAHGVANSPSAPPPLPPLLVTPGPNIGAATVRVPPEMQDMLAPRIPVPPTPISSQVSAPQEPEILPDGWKSEPNAEAQPVIEVHNPQGALCTIVLHSARPMLLSCDSPLNVHTVQPGTFNYELRGAYYRKHGDADSSGLFTIREFRRYRLLIVPTVGTPVVQNLGS